MTIRLANKNEAGQIAKIHVREINQGFLSQLGEKFLTKLYEAMIVSSEAFIVVAEETDSVVGFIGGCVNVNHFYRDFLRKHGPGAAFMLLPKIFKPSILKQIFETLRYPHQKEEIEVPKAELLTIAVLREFHRQGLAQKLFAKFISEMNERGIKQFKVLVGEGLSPAIAFYEKVGFRFRSSMVVHKNKLSKIYVYNIREK